MKQIDKIGTIEFGDVIIHERRIYSCTGDICEFYFNSIRDGYPAISYQ
jgi:hypothetical protein